MKFICTRCKVVHNRYMKKCVCGNMLTIVPIPYNSIRDIKTRKSFSSLAVKTLRTTGKKISNFEFLGELPKQVLMMVWGEPGSGKSTFCLKLANELAKENTVLYWSIEESIGESLLYKLKQFNIGEPKLIFTIVDNLRHFLKEIEVIRPYHVVIDSVNVASIKKAEHLIKIRNLIKGFLIYIFHHTKTGTYKGDW